MTDIIRQALCEKLSPERLNLLMQLMLTEQLTLSDKLVIELEGCSDNIKATIFEDGIEMSMYNYSRQDLGLEPQPQPEITKDQIKTEILEKLTPYFIKQMFETTINQQWITQNGDLLSLTGSRMILEARIRRNFKLTKIFNFTIKDLLPQIHP